MRKKINAPVDHLRIFPTTRDETTVNGTARKVDGALILSEEVGGTTAIKLTGKQLDNLAGIAGINRTGRDAWNMLKALVGVDRSRANLTVESYKEGDEYVKADNTVGKHTKTGENVQVDAIAINPHVQAKIDKAVVDVLIGWNNTAVPTLESLKDGDEDGMTE